MSSTSEILLDITTHYSILGLSSGAIENDIHKSYMKLARQLHPDKSKSDATGEQFKLISHAHHVLMDKEQRLKYDDLLRSRGLLDYRPKEKYHKYVGITKKDDKHVNKSSTKHKATKGHQPYEQQPYGFGTDNSKNSHSHPKVPIFQSFNLKNYQRKQRSAQEKTPDGPSAPNPFFQQSDHEKKENNQKNTPPPSRMGAEDRGRVRAHDLNKDDDEVGERQESAEDEQLRSKIHKVGISYHSDGVPSSPFSDNQHRHYARTKHEAKVRSRRSTSPIKAIPTSESPGMAESWSGLKDILNNIPSSKETDTKDTKPRDANHSNFPTKVRNGHHDGIKLDDLGSSLPIDDDSFDMQKVGDILEDVPTVKRAKKDKMRNSLSDIEMISPAKSAKVPTKYSGYTSRFADPLHMPVNQPLPKVYKSDNIALDQYKIESQITQWDLPVMPVFQCNVLNSAEVEQCKRSVVEFNAKCNSMKQELLATMIERLQADQELNERLVKIENVANWVSCKDFDFEVVSKLSELQNRQRIVAQSFFSLLKSIYATGHQ